MGTGTKILKWNTAVSRMRILIVVILSVLLVFTACAGSGKGNPATIVIAGSTSVQPLSEELAEAFMDKYEDINVEVQGGGSGQGIKAVQSGIADFGALSREVTADESTSLAANTYMIALDGIAVIVSKENAVADLSVDQLRAIFKGELRNWKDVGGTDRPITVVSREAGSGTRTAFTEIIGVTDKNAAGIDQDHTVGTSIIQGSTGAVLQTVAGTQGSIGYVSLGFLDDSVTAVQIGSIEASEQSVLDGTYPITRPFLYVSGDVITLAAQQWIDFVLSDEGQQIVKASGFIPIR